ncbi:MAG TPA: ParB/RepB/Spo0J family partition protein [Pyrinomonadaceae bacterium]|jgi:ParB family chromosome partitioning protein|nr:ParB/RepB/Spo0J family partition protein [Pyrinomonadaceae bacterium]
MTRKVLGRGLGALLSAEGTAVALENTNEVSIDLIDASGFQPRNTFNEAKLEELSNSIRTNGVVQPVLLRRKGGRFELIAGERRWRAAQRAGLTRIPAVVRDVPDEKVLEIALIENIQREDLNPIEEASAYKNLCESLGLTQEMVAEKVGRDRSYVTNYLRLLKLPPDIQELVQVGRLSAGHGRTLLGVESADIQRRISRKIIEQDLSVRATEQLIRRAANRQSVSSRRSAEKPAELDANTRAAENKLRRHLGTKVRIVPITGNSPGRIELEFYQPSDLTRLYDKLIK